MTMDKVTEMVAHMIGIFHLETEDQRLRDEYGAFKALLADEPDTDPISSLSVTFKASHDLGGFAPRLSYSDVPPPGATLDPLLPKFMPFGDYVDISGGRGAELQVIGIIPVSTGSFSISTGALRLEPPGSVAVITSQFAWLYDDDLLLMGDGTAQFVDPAVHLAHLVGYQTIAASLTGALDASALMPGPDAQDEAESLHAMIGAFQGSNISGVSEYVAHGQSTFGLFQNGEEASEQVDLDDVMPAYLVAKAGRTDDGDEETDTDDDAAMEAPDPFAGLSGDDGPLPYRPDIDSQNLMVAGGNTMINQVAISSAWLDAPVIAVMGDVFHLNAVIQTNMIVQHATGSAGSALPNGAINSAAFSLASSDAADETEEDTAEDSGPLVLPSNWAVTRIEGDLIAVNHVHQYSFQTDHDRAEITFGSSDLFVGLGDNTIVNLTDLAQLGFGYDLIFVGGAMISVNWIKQMNVLIDNDAITYSNSSFDGFQMGGQAGVQVGGNLVFNAAQINEIGVDSYAEMQANFAAAAESMAAGASALGAEVAQDALFNGIETLRALFIDGDLVSVNWLEQTNILGDSDQVHLAQHQIESAAGVGAEIITGSNALMNLASVTQYGTDSTVMVGGDVYDDALLYQVELIDTDADPLGTMMPPLEPSAVAFLADGMLEPDMGPMDDPITPTCGEGYATSDVMQTMLA